MIVSALLVGFIVIATLTGFDVTNRVTAEQRHRNEAAVLAAESQEQLRSDPASTLDELQITAHEYKRTVDKIEYTIKQEASFVNDEEPGVSCEASSAKQSNQNGDYLRITSTVTWAQQTASHRPAVKQSSIITPPIGSALEVDVGNQPTPTAGVSGITAIVKYTPVKGSTSAALEATTGSAGCVIFGAIPSTEATLEILEKIGYVTTTGAVNWPTKEVSIAPNLTTHEAVTLNEGGAIKAEFTYKGSASAEVLGKGKETVTGDTFVAFNSNSEGSEYEVGSTGFEYEAGGEEKYAAKTGTYLTTALTAGAEGKTIKYPRGDLFPFSASKWTVYAGDCTSNDTGKEAEVAASVEPAKTTIVKVPTSYVNLSVWTGKYSASAGSRTSELLPVKITNTACASAAMPNNAWNTNYVHTQKLASEGHLERPFQPFGAGALCVASTKEKRTYTYSYENTAAKGAEPAIYLAQKSTAERAKEATEAKTAKETRETEELAERNKWKEEEKNKKITKAQREAKESTQTTNRKAAEKAEETAKETRETEEAKEKANKVTVESGTSTCS